MTRSLRLSLILGILLSYGISPGVACTGITLHAKDGAIVYGRTLEWGAFDLKSRLVIFSRGPGAAEGSDDGELSTKRMHSATIWTSATNLTNKIYYYHTQHNRRVRAIDVGAIDFAALRPGMKVIPLDKEKTQDIEEVKLDTN